MKFHNPIHTTVSITIFTCEFLLSQLDRAAFTLDRPKSGRLERGALSSPGQDSNKTATPLQEKAEASRAQTGSPMNLEAPTEKGRPHSR